jgi:hypothetical protein
MFFASVGKEGGESVDLFAYFLADRLGKTLAEIDDMPHAEYTAWRSFHKVKGQQEQLNAKKARHG